MKLLVLFVHCFRFGSLLTLWKAGGDLARGQLVLQNEHVEAALQESRVSV